MQFQETTGGEYTLVIKDSDGSTLAILDFTEIATGVYTVSFIPEDEGICDEEIQLFIAGSEVSDTAGTEIISNDTFTATLLPWVSVAGPNINWTLSGGTVANVAFTGGAESSDVLGQDFTEQPAGYYYLLVRTILSTTGSVLLTVNVYNNGVLVQESLSQAYSNTAATDFTYNVHIEGVFDRIELVASRNGAGALNFGVSTASLRPRILSEANNVAKSDCLNIKTDQDETVLITYSDNKNYAGLNYSLVSPDPEFNIRVPATFFHERFPEESEVIELSNSRSIQLNAQVKAQRQLEIGPLPYYMHRKLKLILKHQFVTIDDQDWVQSEQYEITEGSRRSPHKQAKVWLTEKDYIIRNVL